jgi:uncharacterized protein
MHLLRRISEFKQDNPSDSVKFVFHGGEPFLIGASEFSWMVRVLREEFGSGIRLAVQTNGTIYNPRIIEACVLGDVSVGVSVDGARKHHDSVRVDRRGSGSWDGIYQNLGRFLDHRRRDGLRFHSVIVVANPAVDVKEMFSLCDEFDLAGLSILLPDTNIDARAAHYSFSDRELSDWLIKAMSYWIYEYRHIRVPLFNGVFSKLFGAMSDSESIGNSLVPAVIIESSGEITPHDVLRISGPTSKSKLFVSENRLADIWHDDIYRIANCGNQNLCKKCLDCPIVNICGGGFIAHRYSRELGFQNPSVWCNVLQAIIGFAMGRIVAISDRND